MRTYRFQTGSRESVDVEARDIHHARRILRRRGFAPDLRLLYSNPS